MSDNEKKDLDTIEDNIKTSLNNKSDEIKNKIDEHFNEKKEKLDNSIEKSKKDLRDYAKSFYQNNKSTIYRIISYIVVFAIGFCGGLYAEHRWLLDDHGGNESVTEQLEDARNSQRAERESITNAKDSISRSQQSINRSENAINRSQQSINRSQQTTEQIFRIEQTDGDIIRQSQQILAGIQARSGEDGD